VWPICGICMRTGSGEIDRVYAIVLSGTFESSCRIDRIAASVSCQYGLLGRPTFQSSSLPQGTSLIHLNAEARQYSAGSCRFRRRVTISLPARAPKRRNSMTDHCLSLRSIVTCRFWQFRNRHRAPSCDVIIIRNAQSENRDT
jgi:hypothetical protein